VTAEAAAARITSEAAGHRHAQLVRDEHDAKRAADGAIGLRIVQPGEDEAGWVARGGSALNRVGVRGAI